MNSIDTGTEGGRGRFQGKSRCGKFKEQDEGQGISIPNLQKKPDFKKETHELTHLVQQLSPLLITTSTISIKSFRPSFLPSFLVAVVVSIFYKVRSV